MTMKELARLANASVSTVSKAFSGSSEISSRKREEIFEIAKREGCFEKYYKPEFQKSVIAVICPEFRGGYYPQQLDYFEKEIKKHGGIMIAACFDFEEESKKELLSYFSENVKASGIILIGSMPDGTDCKTPVISIGGGNNDSILLSSENSMKDMVGYFIENGHEQIAYIGERLTSGKGKKFVSLLEASGIKVSGEYIIEEDERFEEAGYNAMNKLLSLENPPTAVFAAYDRIAVGAMKSIYEHGLKIPDDISLIGSDAEDVGMFLDVELTSVSSYNEDLCEIMVNMIFDKILHGESDDIKKVKISTELVKRKSVGKIKS